MKYFTIGVYWLGYITRVFVTIHILRLEYTNAGGYIYFYTKFTNEIYLNT